MGRVMSHRDPSPGWRPSERSLGCSPGSTTLRSGHGSRRGSAGSDVGLERQDGPQDRRGGGGRRSWRVGTYRGLCWRRPAVAPRTSRRFTCVSEGAADGHKSDRSGRPRRHRGRSARYRFSPCHDVVAASSTIDVEAVARDSGSRSRDFTSRSPCSTGLSGRRRSSRRSRSRLHFGWRERPRTIRPGRGPAGRLYLVVRVPARPFTPTWLGKVTTATPASITSAASLARIRTGSGPFLCSSTARATGDGSTPPRGLRRSPSAWCRAICGSVGSEHADDTQELRRLSRRPQRSSRGTALGPELGRSNEDLVSRIVQILPPAQLAEMLWLTRCSSPGSKSKEMDVRAIVDERRTSAPCRGFVVVACLG